MAGKQPLFPVERIERDVLLIRGQKVMLDTDWPVPSEAEGLPSGLSLRFSHSAELTAEASGSKTWQAICGWRAASRASVEWCPERATELRVEGLSRFSVPLISAVSVLAGISLYVKKRWGAFS